MGKFLISAVASLVLVACAGTSGGATTALNAGAAFAFDTQIDSTLVPGVSMVVTGGAIPPGYAYVGSSTTTAYFRDQQGNVIERPIKEVRGLQ